ncbi:penicillin-binding protein activator [Candidatus Providencia siddallii]
MIQQNKINIFYNNIFDKYSELLNIYKNYKDNYILSKINLTNWKISNVIDSDKKISNKYITKIAFFLPITGSFKTHSNAIIQGFIDAKKIFFKKFLNDTHLFYNKKQNKDDDIINEILNDIFLKRTTEKSNINNKLSYLENIQNNNTEIIKIFDTSNNKISDLLEQAKNENFNIIIGPLLKKNVETITKIESSMKIIALNELNDENLQSKSNIFYFSLSPENEAQNAAIHIREEGKKTPLVLVPSNKLGERIIKAFTKEWQKKNKTTVFMQTFGSISSLKRLINNGIGIKLVGTPVIIDKFNLLKNKKINKKIDSVYIFANYKELLFIHPMIKMTVNSKLCPTLYASSRINQNNLNIDYNFEMENLQFNEIPMIANINNNSAYIQALKKVNNDYFLLRLYAMGVDARLLVNNYDKLKKNNQLYINGVSGLLNLTNKYVVYRKLLWLKFQNGEKKLIN